jgi:hypothetical protein
MPRDYRVLLEDIAGAAEAIREFTAGMTKDEVTADRKTRDAVIGNLEVIGEAVNRLPRPFSPSAFPCTSTFASTFPLTLALICASIGSRDGEIGRRKGLKIPRSSGTVPVRVRLPAVCLCWAGNPSRRFHRSAAGWQPSRDAGPGGGASCPAICSRRGGSCEGVISNRVVPMAPGD